MSEGSVETSRIFVMNSDGSGHQDLGPGCLLSLSPDNSEIVFTQSNVGISDRTNTFVAVADVSTDSQFRLMRSGPEFVSEFITWHPDNERVVFSVGEQASPLSSLLIVNRNAPSNKETIPGPPTDWNILSTDWSPDGRLILFTAHGPPQPVEWPFTGL